MTLAAKTCATCGKPCYPTERIRVSDLWVHKHCLKCSECNTTLSLNSVYLAPSPALLTGGPAAIISKQLFCAKDVPKIVHTSIVDSVALKTAMKAPKPTTVPAGVMEPKLAGQGKHIRFKGLTLRSKSIAASLNAPKLDIPGQMRSKVIVGQVGNIGLDSWDIAHALSVQSQVSAPIRSHPAIHAQRTGSSATQFPMPSQPLEPQYTGQSGTEQLMSAQKGEEEVRIEADLVKNLIKVFQLDSLEQVEVSSDILAPAEPLTPDLTGSSAITGAASWQNTVKPASMRLDTAPSTIRTLRTLGLNRKRGTLTLARAKGNLKRPALSELFINDSLDDRANEDQAEEAVVDERFLNVGSVPAVPQNTPAKGLRSNDTFTSKMGSIRKNSGTIRAGRLLEAFLPLAAHLVPLPTDDEDDLELINGYLESGDDELDRAQNQLVDDLELEGLELIMLFEEEPILACVT